MKKVQTIVERLNRTRLEIGGLETRKHSLLHYVASTQDELTLIQAEFEKEYNTGDINIQTGAINYPENGKANKKD